MQRERVPLARDVSHGGSLTWSKFHTAIGPVGSATLKTYFRGSAARLPALSKACTYNVLVPLCIGVIGTFTTPFVSVTLTWFSVVSTFSDQP